MTTTTTTPTATTSTTSTTPRPSYERPATDDLELLLGTLPPHVREPLDGLEHLDELLEIVMDLGRQPEARFPGREVILSDAEIVATDLEFVVARIGSFGDDNRAGIPRTLHRISAIRNRKREIVGLTCRVGRSVLGTMDIIRDLVESGRSTLILGKPGVGKTTLLREVARVLADELKKRVIIVDTSNEIAGDGDIPHPGIGRARRMQVPTPTEQHAVMIEAVENHMPEVIVIDEIGTELEAEAARTIAERGVQLVGTAHGNALENLMINPTLSDLVGGIQPVTLGDEEARRRGTQKTVLERKAPPTFDVLVEMQDRQKVAVHRDVAETVDAVLRGQPVPVELRWRDPDGTVQRRLEIPARFGPADDRGRGLRTGHDGGYADRRDRGGDRGGDRDRPPGRSGDRVDRWDRGGRRGRADYWGDRALVLEHDAVEREDYGGRGGRPRPGIDGPGVGGPGAGGASVGPYAAPDGREAGVERVPWGSAAPQPAAATALAAAPAGERGEAGGAGESHERGDSGEAAPAQGSPLRGAALPGERFHRTRAASLKPMTIYPFGVNRDRLEAAVAAMRLPVTITKEPRDADVVMTLKNYYRNNATPVRDAEDAGKPVFILKSNTIGQIQQSLEALYGMQTADPPRDLEDLVLQETQDAIHRVLQTAKTVELPPQNAYIRRLQHQLAEQYNVGSRSAGREPHRRVQLYKASGDGTQRRDRW